MKILIILLLSFNSLLSKNDDTTKIGIYKPNIETSIDNYIKCFKITELSYILDKVIVVTYFGDSFYMYKDEQETFLLKLICLYQPDKYSIEYLSDHNIYKVNIQNNEYGTIYRIKIYFLVSEKDKNIIDHIVVTE